MVIYARVRERLIILCSGHIGVSSPGHQWRGAAAIYYSDSSQPTEQVLPNERKNAYANYRADWKASPL